MINSRQSSSKPPEPVEQPKDIPSNRGGVQSRTDMQRDLLRAQREKAKMAARKASRVTYDLPPDLRESLRVLSEELRIPASQLVALALIRFLKELKSGALDLGNFKKPSRSPRYDWNLDLPKTPKKMEKTLKSLKSLK